MAVLTLSFPAMMVDVSEIVMLFANGKSVYLRMRGADRSEEFEMETSREATLLFKILEEAKRKAMKQ